MEPGRLKLRGENEEGLRVLSLGNSCSYHLNSSLSEFQMAEVLGDFPHSSFYDT